jgi:hypothetical protein
MRCLIRSCLLYKYTCTRVTFIKVILTIYLTKLKILMRIEHRVISVIIIAMLYYIIHSNLAYKKHKNVEKLVKYFNYVISGRVFPGHTNEDKIVRDNFFLPVLGQQLETNPQ